MLSKECLKELEEVDAEVWQTDFEQSAEVRYLFDRLLRALLQNKVDDAQR